MPELTERADIGKGLPPFARGYLNCNGGEDTFGIYADNISSAMLTLSPILGVTGISQIGPAISLNPVFNGVSYPASHRNWEFISGTSDVSTRVKGWARRAGSAAFTYRSKVACITSEVGAIARIRFTGTGLTYYYSQGPTLSKVQVRVDGRLIATVNQYNVAPSYANTYAIAAGTLTASEHLLELISIADGAEAGTNFSVTVEQVDVLPIVGPTYTNGLPQVTNISDTTQLCVGWSVTSALAGVARTIVSIDSTTQITMSGNATGGGDAATTFAPSIDTNYDLFLDNGNLRPFVWASHAAGTSARAAAGGLAIYGGYPSRVLLPSWRYVGMFRTYAAIYTRSYCALSYASRLVWSLYNQARYKLQATFVSGHTYVVAAWRAYAANVTLGECRLDFVVGIPKDYFLCWLLDRITTAAGGSITDGIGLNTITANSISNMVNTSPTAGWTQQFHISGQLLPVAGYNYMNTVEYGSATSHTKAVSQIMCEFIG